MERHLGLLCETLPGIIRAAELSRINYSTTVLIIGQGVSGHILTQVVSLFSPKRLVVTDINQRNLDLARKYGATVTYLLDCSRSIRSPLRPQQ
ncbi:hypothetical protein [Pelagicoccus sp. SDUM812002]|uniref:hypothetical protein n=1 Tax=Pelagicoccus sp. SDUM812002 TaxID=3041266 RepID=UPI00280CFD25|nr:hypothetical protein [Pelagicoccus sp. SDUM812002]MDQ8187904.1 hypothetical protein [Pelagicoccus sp. SDUM812002]